MKSGKFFLFFLLACMVFPLSSYAGALEDGTAAMKSGDYQTAYKLLYPLAEQGNASAQNCIGSMLCEGLGVEKDEAQAVSWYQKAADQGDLEASNALGVMYVNGQGVEKDMQKGLHYIVIAAEKGFKAAQKNAYALYYEEAQKGNVGAFHNVAIMCLDGWAGDVDPNKCIKLLEVAAENGHTKSAGALSQIYSKGMFGIQTDAQKAAYWKNIAENPPTPPAADDAGQASKSAPEAAAAE